MSLQLVKFQIYLRICSAWTPSSAIWAYCNCQHLFIAYSLTAGLPTRSLIHWLVLGYSQSEPPKDIWILNSGCIGLACAFKHQQFRGSPLYPNVPSLDWWPSSSLLETNTCTFFSRALMLGGVIFVPQLFLFLVSFPLYLC